MSGTAIYVYCVLSRSRRPSATRIPAGVPASTPPSVDGVAAGWWLVSAEVPVSEYDSALIQKKIQDLEWVSQIALGHEAVVERFSRVSGATVIPMTLFTMFSNRERAIAEMGSRRRQLEKVAKRIRGSEEWGVRIARKSRPLARGRVKNKVSGPVATSGAAFLAAKKQARDEARTQVAAAAEVAEHALTALSRIAKHSRQQSPPEGATTPPLVDVAFLVPASRKAQFKNAAKREAERCRKAGADLTLTGPWPAYNFIQAEDDAS